MWRGLCHVLWIELSEAEGLRWGGLKVESESRETVGQLLRNDHTQLKAAVISAWK